MKRLLAFALLAVIAGCASNPASDTVPLPDSDSIVGQPTSPENRAKVHTSLAAAYYRQPGKMAVALQEARIAVAADSTYAPAHNMLGLIYMSLHENGLAEESFKRALRYAPHDPGINQNYGWFLCQTSREAQSIPYFMRAIRDPLSGAPAKSEAYASAGTCEMQRGNFKAAEQDFQNALNLQPNQSVALLHLAELRYKQGNYLEARKLVQHFNEVVGETASSVWLALRVERKLGRTVAVSGYADELERRFPKSPEYRKLQRGDYD